jgi:hypothetical protein
MFYVMPYRKAEDPAQANERLDFHKSHATLESARVEAHRLCALGWTAHIGEDPSSDTFIESWAPGPDGPRLEE